MNSIGHLHLHGIALPIRDDYLNNVIYGFKLTSPEKLIEKIKSKSLQRTLPEMMAALKAKAIK